MILVELVAETGQRWWGSAVVKNCGEHGPASVTMMLEGKGPLQSEEPLPLVVRVTLPERAGSQHRESPLGLPTVEQTARLANLGMAADFLEEAMDFALATMLRAGPSDGCHLWPGPLTFEAKLRRLTWFAAQREINTPESAGVAADHADWLSSEDMQRVPGIMMDIAEFREFCDNVRCSFEKNLRHGDMEFLSDASEVERQATRAHQARSRTDVCSPSLSAMKR